MMIDDGVMLNCCVVVVVVVIVFFSKSHLLDGSVVREEMVGHLN